MRAFALYYAPARLSELNSVGLNSAQRRCITFFIADAILPGASSKRAHRALVGSLFISLRAFAFARPAQLVAAGGLAGSRTPPQSWRPPRGSLSHYHQVRASVDRERAPTKVG